MQHKNMNFVITKKLIAVTNNLGHELPIMSSVGQHGIPSLCHIIPSASFTTG
jgi:hypothetical protein